MNTRQTSTTPTQASTTTKRATTTTTRTTTRDGGSGGGEFCENGPDPEEYCWHKNMWACTDVKHKEYFSTNCKKLCGLCGKS